jgi:hypothetical protein
LQQRVPADQLDLVEEHHPAGVAPCAQEPRQEPQPLAGQVPDLDRGEGERLGLTDCLELAAQVWHQQRVT